MQRLLVGLTVVAILHGSAECSDLVERKLDPALKLLYRAQVEVAKSGSPRIEEGMDVVTLFQRQTRAAASVTPLRLIVRFHGEEAALEAAGFHIQARLGEIYTGSVEPRSLHALAELEDIQVVNLSQPMHALMQPASRWSVAFPTDGSSMAETAASPIPLTAGTGVLIGYLDTGVDIQHHDFRRPDGTTRIRYLLDLSYPGDLDGDGFLDGPDDFGGTLYTEAEINRALKPPRSFPQKDSTGHGTHGLSVAAGEAPTFHGVAPGSDLIVVNAARVAGTLEFESADIINALSFIDQQAALIGMPYVANLSLGTAYGPHDGTTLEEAAIDSLVGSGKPGKVIVVAAGNSGDMAGREYRHIQGRALAGLENHHPLVVPKLTNARPGPGNDQVLVDLWYKGADRITVSVTAPDGRTRVEAPYGQFARESTPFGDVLIANMGGTSPLNGDTEALVLLHDQSGIAPASGTWKISLRGEEVSGEGIYHGWLVETASKVGGKDPYFSGAADNLFSVARPGTARHAITVGSFARHDPATRYRTSWQDVRGVLRRDGTARAEELSGFSSAGWTRDGRLKPDLVAPGEQVRGAVSRDAYPGLSRQSIYALHPFSRIDALIVKNDRGGAFGMLQGTSFSAPVVTGLAARILAVNPTLDAAQVKNILINSAQVDSFTGTVPNYEWGYGKVDLGIAREPSSPLPGTLRMTPETLPTGTVGSPYSVLLEASGGQPPYLWSLAGGSLPPGLTLAAGQLSGQPVAAGTYRFAVQVADSSNPRQQAARELTLRIAAVAPLAIGDRYLPAARVGRTYSESLRAEGGTRPYTWSLLGGSLPTGVALTAQGALGGVPSHIGRYSFTLQVADSTGLAVRQSFSLVVASEEGFQWYRLGSFNVARVTSIAVDPSYRQRIAAGVFSGFNTGYVALSENDGHSWTDISIHAGLVGVPFPGMSRLEFDPLTSTLWGLDDIFRYPYLYDRASGLWNSWSYCRWGIDNEPRLADLAFDRVGNLDILPHFISCESPFGPREHYSGFLKSPDGGRTWWEGGQFSDDIEPAYWFVPWGRLSVYKSDPSYIYASRVMTCRDTSVCEEVYQKSYRSLDGGAHWQEMAAGAPDLVHLVVSQKDPFDIIRYSSGFAPKGGSPSPYIERSRNGGATWSRISLPGGSGVCSLERSESNPEVVLVATSTGLHRTVDGGQTWATLTIPRVRTDQCAVDLWRLPMVIDPVDPEVLWVGTYATGLFKSVDGGLSWSPRNNGLTYFETFEMTVNPFNPNHIFASTQVGGFVSKNGGKNWVYSPGVGYGQPVFSSRPGRLYVASYSRHIFRSDNAGVTWVALGPVGGTFPAPRIVSLAVDPRDPDRLTARTARNQDLTTGAETAELWRSADGGATWSRLADVAAPPRYFSFYDDSMTYMESYDMSDVIAYARDVPGRLFTTGDDGIYRSDDDGQSWRKLAYPEAISMLRAEKIEPAPSDSRYLYAVVSKTLYGVCVFGPDGSVTYRYFFLPFRTLAVDPHDPQVAYAGERGVYKTVNAGQTWSALPSVLDKLTVISLVAHPERSGVVYAGTLENGVFLSEDGGASWRRLDAFGTVADTVNTVAVSPRNPLTVYAGTEGFGVQKSGDGGEYFSPLVEGLGNLDVLSLAVDKQLPDLLFAGTRQGLFKTENGGVFWKPTDVTDGVVTDISIDDGTRPRRVRITTFGGGMAVSEDEGETFHPSNHGLASLDLTSIEAEPRGGTERLWVTMKGGDGVAYSDDGGQSWTPAAGEGLGNHNVNDLIVGLGGRLWVATEGGIFFSGDGGRSWKERNVGLPAGVPITSLAIDSMNGEVLAGLYSGANGGVYRGGEDGIWRPFNAGLGELRVQELTLVRSPESLTLFAATAGDGLYASDLEALGDQTPSVTTRSLPLGRVGREYSVALAATGGSKPYGWSLVGGSLPPGLGLTASGTIAGLPISSGSYDFTIQITDARSSFARKSLSIRVSAAQ
jgi:photosystem II stability/assembly factor-like uncharacterized protein